ncbi:MAG TPA: DUF6448 family protein [Candidatus Eisenbacteria bacterium]|nr:DUF6448 family protein [Candidatus Eisenbacteria bacterium]
MSSPRTASLVLAVTLALAPIPALAHCDGLDGPVVKAAETALERNDVNLVLVWVQPQDEAEIRAAFDHAVAVRKLGPEARKLADTHLFETLVRVHRAGEGAPYTGLKPAGRDLGPAIPAADRAIETGDRAALLALLRDALDHGLEPRFEEAVHAKSYPASDVAAGRKFVAAYVAFVHYVEGLHRAATGASAPHEEAGLEAGPETGRAAGHEHGAH